MTGNGKISIADIASLRVLRYPDPRLTRQSISIEEVDDSVRALAERMFLLMLQHKGVGLAASQVGVAVRLFVASPSMEPDDLHAYVNPRIVSAEGWIEDEEGCLSFPDIHCRIKRSAMVTMEATDLQGRLLEYIAEGFAARVFEHELDHLDGRLLIDRMGSVAKITNRRLLNQLEEDYAAAAS